MSLLSLDFQASPICAVVCSAGPRQPADGRGLRLGTTRFPSIIMLAAVRKYIWCIS